MTGFVTSVNRGVAAGTFCTPAASSPDVSDAEHELLKDNTEQGEEIALLRMLLARTARAAIDAQERADGRHEPWLDDALAEAQVDD